MQPERRPYGRDEVMESILDAARDLFAERGPASVSTRAIAERAQVNHALIHRHFRTKENLLHAVLHREAMGFSGAIENIADPATSARRLFEENAAREPFVRILAFSMLSGFSIEHLYSEKGALAPLLRRLAEDRAAGPASNPPSVDPRVLVAAVSAFMKGWLLFEDWVMRAVGMSASSRDGAREQVSLLLEHLMTATAGDAVNPRSGGRRPRGKRLK